MELKGHDKYRLGQPLGAGGMAEVFLAEMVGAEGFTRPLAIKRILPEHSANELFAKMFVNEARISSFLSHPNVVSVIDFDRDADNCLFLVMELVVGKDLNQLVKSEAFLPLPVVIFVISEVLRGLGYAHELVADGKHLGIVHRDVSPHNVLLSWEGAVKVSDFGIAKAAAATDATRSGMLKGKVSYMSPEQANQQPLDGRSDLFAVGIMLYEMLVGHPPFQGGSISEILAHMLVRPPVPPRQLRPELPEDIERVTLKLLEKDRDHRYATGHDAARDLLACAHASTSGADELASLLATWFPGEIPPRPTRASAAATAIEVKHTPTPSLGDAAPRPATLSYSHGTTPTPAGQVGAAQASAIEAARAPTSSRKQLLVALAMFLAVAAAGTLAVMSLTGGDKSPTAASPTASFDAASAAIDAGVADAAISHDATVDANPREPLPLEPKKSTKKRRRPKKRDHKKPRENKPSAADWDIEIGKENQ